MMRMMMMMTMMSSSLFRLADSSSLPVFFSLLRRLPFSLPLPPSLLPSPHAHTLSHTPQPPPNHQKIGDGFVPDEAITTTDELEREERERERGR